MTAVAVIRKLKYGHTRCQAHSDQGFDERRALVSFVRISERALSALYLICHPLPLATTHLPLSLNIFQGESKRNVLKRQRRDRNSRQSCLGSTSAGYRFSSFLQ
jgi:hypothetical protein